MSGYLQSKKKNQCFGCEACAQICGRQAITMKEDKDGFRYPIIDTDKCVECGLCYRICPYENMPAKYEDEKYTFGGYTYDEKVRFNSTSGGAFSAIVDAYCDDNYVIFGAESKGLRVFHSYIIDKRKLKKFRKSKYSQSVIGSSYKDVKNFLNHGKKVLFSGTPCQIAGLRSYLRDVNQENLLTVEVVCEGVPSPLYIRKYENYLVEKYKKKIKKIDYRYKGKSIFLNGKWDFQVMKIKLEDTFGNKSDIDVQQDRWLNPFWTVWLNHLMSRPSCYHCPYTTQERVADITLGDLWGIHLYCPELYGKNGGASLVVCNTQKGKDTFSNAQKMMYGHELEFETALKYQSPMRKTIDENLEYDEFMKDLRSDMDYIQMNKKWASKPSFKFLWQKYIWGNRQKIFLWNLTHGMYRIR